MRPFILPVSEGCTGQRLGFVLPCCASWTQLSFEVFFGPGAYYYLVRAETEPPANYPKGPIIGYSAPIWLNMR